MTFEQSDHRGRVFFDIDPDREQRFRFFAENKAGFGREDRFLYKKLEQKLVACNENVGPSTYDQLDAFKSLTKLPCYTLIVSI